MSLVTHKYTPGEMSDHELQATFAARGHTLDYILKSLRDQIHSGTLSSFVITGPPGAGKSMMIHLVALRIRQDPDLNAAWIPIMFPEEQFNIVSLRDLLAATLEVLAKDGLSSAKVWVDKVQKESNDEQSQQLAITGLREISRQTGKRFILFVENLNLVLAECFTGQMKGTLRRLLMTDPFMMLIGSSVHIFDSLKNYDEAFFNYFGMIRLDRLDEDQVFELLTLRARFDSNERFLKNFPKEQPKIRAIAQLSGGNPRLILMLYELLSQEKVTTIVPYLRRLVEDLTPLLKDEVENRPPQQRKIIHALMEKGGTAQPTDLVGPTRLPLNVITMQLKRLKDAQIVEVLGGGKGRAANYTVPDRLFTIWYQMRYLGQNRRRIEMFAEILGIWFEAEERFKTIKKPAAVAAYASPMVLRDSQALLNREVATVMLGDDQGTIEDWNHILEHATSPDDAVLIAAEALFRTRWLDGNQEEADRILDRLVNLSTGLPKDKNIFKLVEFLARLALPTMRRAWAHAWRKFAQRLPSAEKQELSFLDAVCSVLEGSDPSALNPLPPEQRDFAQRMLSRFDTDPV